MTIKELRRQKKMTQSELAKAINVNKSVISRYEHGTLIPPLKRLYLIAQVLDVPLDSIDVDFVTYRGQISLVPSMSPQTLKSLEMKKFVDKVLIEEANGKCELCHNDAPFCSANGRPYLKIYEIKDNNAPLPEQSFIALCPNCYERLIVLKDTDDISAVKQIAKNHVFFD